MEFSLKKDEDYYLDQDGVSYESPLNWLWVGILGGCGCGSSEELSEVAFKVLELFSKSSDDWDKRDFSVYDKPEYEILAHWFTDKDLTEHGTSIGGSWLSEKGSQVYKSIKKELT